MNKGHLTPEIVLQAYTAGLFPMADGREDNRLYWIDPEKRGILPLQNFHVSRSLKRALKKSPFTVTINQSFSSVIHQCATVSRHKDKGQTWINYEIEELYTRLHHMGFAHSIECWHETSLVGGLYGIAIHGAFFGESMFHKAHNASKIALINLVARLIEGGFCLLDTQFYTEHLGQFGAIEVAREDYQKRLTAALAKSDADFYRLPVSCAPSEIIQLITQTS